MMYGGLSATRTRIPVAIARPMVIKLAEAQYGDNTIFKTLIADHSGITASQ